MDWMDGMSYRDVAYQHDNTRWTRRDGFRLLAKVRVAGSNPVVRSKNYKSARLIRSRRRPSWSTRARQNNAALSGNSGRVPNGADHEKPDP